MIIAFLVSGSMMRYVYVEDSFSNSCRRRGLMLLVDESTSYAESQIQHMVSDEDFGGSDVILARL